MSCFKKYKCLTISEKNKVIESVEEGERKVDVAKAFEIPLSSLSTILKNKEKIFSESSSRVKKRVSEGSFPCRTVFSFMDETVSRTEYSDGWLFIEGKG
ncbi:hypothetical protein TNCV_433761 [Trichonephila clavipes]|nr:hypothetical protein TNCV_433761 [Trichonephila clavipes]